MVSVRDKVYTVKVHDASLEQKNAENFLVQMKDAIKIVEKEWHVEVIAFTTDASGKSRKARRLLAQESPHLVTPDCLAHQINLIVGNYFKKERGFLTHCTNATELIAWIRSKTYLLALIRQTQLASNPPGQKPVTIIRAVLTRWTAHYLAFRRLLELRPTLQHLASGELLITAADRRQIITGNKKAQEKALEMLGLIQDPYFWASIERMKNHLEPLAVAANITQAATARLDQVLFTFGFLYLQFSKLQNPQDQGVRETVLRSLEERWSKCDQDVFIAAAILNPFVSMNSFQQLSFTSTIGINGLLQRLWRRFYQTAAPAQILSNIEHFFRRTGPFAYMVDAMTSVNRQADENNEQPNPLHVYKGFSFPGRSSGGMSIYDPTSEPPLVTLGRRVLSISANSTSCERLFSVFGNILTKLRNRLATTTLANLAELRMIIRDQHHQSGETKKRLKWKFGDLTSIDEHDPADTQPSHKVSSPSMDPINPSATSLNPPQTHFTAGSSSRQQARSGGGNSSDAEFLTMVARMEQMVDEDADDPASVNMILSSSSSTQPIKVAIGDLFDFNSALWVEKFQTQANHFFRQEAEFSELIDRGSRGAGSDGAVVDLDDNIQALIDM